MPTAIVCIALAAVPPTIYYDLFLGKTTEICLYAIKPHLLARWGFLVDSVRWLLNDECGIENGGQQNEKGNPTNYA